MDYQHPKIKFLPVGRDFRSISSFKYSNSTITNRPILCYCNFSVRFPGYGDFEPRIFVYNTLKHKKFVTFEHMDHWLKYSLSRDDFFKKLSMSKFVVCPIGVGLDCFKFYDAIYSGAIPIVVKEVFHDEAFFNDVPILYLDSINEFKNLTEDFLNQKYEELSPKIKSYYQGLDMDLFLKNLDDEIKHL